MKKKSRRSYTDAFKDEAVKLVTEQGYKISEAARNLGIHDSLLRRWIKDRSPEKDESPAGTVKLRTGIHRYTVR